MPSSARLTLTGAAACAALGAVLLAQTPPTFRAGANYVRVDAYPTHDGAPVADLKAEDFEVLDAGVPQKIDQFEHVVIRGLLPQEARVEPNTVAESRAMLENPRARVFVLFLDTYHVDVLASRRIRQPLIDALNRLIGPDDLVAVMTPEMSARDIAFARKTTTVEGFLTRYWPWGERDRMNPRDPEDQAYAACYVAKPQIAAAMIDRRHERIALTAMADLVGWLRGLREERKAIITISNGWLLYRPDPGLMQIVDGQGVQSGPTPGIDPRSGKLTTKDAQPANAQQTLCAHDRMTLAQIDDEQDFRRLLDEANRANASFYPIDPRGLAVFDTPMLRQDTLGAPLPMVSPAVDQAMLKARVESLRTIAEATDGLAVVNTNDLDAGFTRVVSDLTSYYLIGYYASTKLDGKFHAITVRVKRPGVQVRARRGYLAADAAAVERTAATAATPPAPTAVDVEAGLVRDAIAPLAEYAREVPMRVQMAAGWKPGPQPTRALWVVGEIGGVAQTGEEWKDGFDATVSAVTRDGRTLASGRADVPRGTRSFRVALTPSASDGEWVVRAGARAGAAQVPNREVAHVAPPGEGESAGVLFYRRGQATANREVPTADVRFRRAEQLRAEIPTLSEAAGSARLLDRTGKPLQVPVSVSIRDDADGSRWRSAQLALAPLAPGDYVIEMVEEGKGAGAMHKSLVAFRIVP